MFSLQTLQSCLLFLALTCSTTLLAKDECHYPFPLRYKIYDLGETDLPSEYLARHAWPISLGPRINNQGHIIWNTSNGGVFWDRCNRRRFFYYKKYPAFFHAINDKGLTLTSVNSETGKNWFLWPSSIWRSQESLLELPFRNQGFATQYHFFAINNNSTIVGTKIENNIPKFLFWTPERQERYLDFGPVFDVNNSDRILGLEICDPEKKPFIWQVKSGLIAFSDDMKLNRPSENVLFRESAIASDNTVFGSYIGTKDNFMYHWSYSWNPCDDLFIKMDLDQMKISAVNSIHTLVGSVNGHAAISYKGSAPAKLSELANYHDGSLHLLEATDINDLGEIVGYGLWEDEMRIFLLIPECEP